MGGAYIAHFAMYATLEDRTHGKKRPCVRHPEIGHEPLFLGAEAVKYLEHFVGRLYYPRVRFVGTLRQDHLNEFLNNVDVGLLEHPLLQSAKPVRPTRVSDDGLAGGCGRGVEVLSKALK